MKQKEYRLIDQYLRQINQLIGFAPLLSGGVGGGGLPLYPTPSPNGRGALLIRRELKTIERSARDIFNSRNKFTSKARLLSYMPKNGEGIDR